MFWEKMSVIGLTATTLPEALKPTSRACGQSVSKQGPVAGIPARS
jgi:hypothetical protein